MCLYLYQPPTTTNPAQDMKIFKYFSSSTPANSRIWDKDVVNGVPADNYIVV